jgi:hypothetical protein
MGIIGQMINVVSITCHKIDYDDVVGESTYGAALNETMVVW